MSPESASGSNPPLANGNNAPVHSTLLDQDEDVDKPKKRKKAARACNHCQTAHLTCDDNRPCLRCIKRNLGETCQDGSRKKAKYLRDIDDAVVNQGKTHPTPFTSSSDKPSKRRSSPSQSEVPEPPSIKVPDPLPDTLFDNIFAQTVATIEPSPNSVSNPEQPSPMQSISTSGTVATNIDDIFTGYDQAANSAFNPANHGQNPASSAPMLSPFGMFTDFSTTGDFGSQSANLEYAVLSSMLQNSGWNASPTSVDQKLPGASSTANPAQTQSSSLYPSISTGYADFGTGSVPTRLSSFGLPLAAFEGDPRQPTLDTETPYFFNGNIQPHPPPEQQSINPMDAFPNNAWSTTTPAISHPLPSSIQPLMNPTPVTDGTASPTRVLVSAMGTMRAEDVYRHVNKPYSHLEGYHALIRHLQNNFKNKSDILRIIRALSIYRPSIIALQMPLTLDDEIFVERSFQRTLIELEKLISFSGTPTVVWRRTGEITLAGTEFTLLSEWSREQLLGGGARPKRKYIFEIFDDKSTVAYYESFAAHAFESSTSTITTTCNIVTPNGRRVPCTFGYNFKRDIFGLPSMIVGQFLPILSHHASH